MAMLRMRTTILTGVTCFASLVDFEWDKRAGGDDGEVFGPAFAKQKAGAFGKEIGRIEKGSDAEELELMRAHVRKARARTRVDIVVFGVDAQGVDPVFESAGQIVMQKAQRA